MAIRLKCGPATESLTKVFHFNCILSPNKMSTLICFALKEKAAPFRKIAAGNSAESQFTSLALVVALKIAQPFMAGSCVNQTNQVPEGRKECSAVPDGTRKIERAFFPAINGWAIFGGQIILPLPFNILKQPCTPCGDNHVHSHLLRAERSRRAVSENRDWKTRRRHPYFLSRSTVGAASL